jgi:hypothetical protein
MTRLAEETSNVIVGLADITKGLADLVNLGGIGEIEFGTQGAKIKDLFNLNLIPIIGPLLEAARQRGKTINTPGMGGYPSSALGPGYFDQNEAKRKAVEADRLKKEKARLALEKKGTVEAKKKAALEKAARTLELERINLTAALKGNISETDRLSLNLQLALLDKNDTAATKLAKELDAAVKNNALLQAALIATPEAPNPYRNWKVPDLGPLGGLAAGVIAGVDPNKPVVVVPTPPPPPAFNVPELSPETLRQFGPLGGLGAGVIAGVNPSPIVNVTVTMDGKELTTIITDTQINDSLSGSFGSVNRSSFKGAVAI